MNVSAWCSRIIRYGFFLLFSLVPLLLTPWNYELFEYNKMMAVYGLTVAIAGSWLIKSISQKEFRIAKTPLDIPILLFLTSQLLSSLFSIDPHVSWFGYYSRFNAGMWSVISYVILYYAFISNIKNITIFIKASLSTLTIVALYGVAERLGIDKHLWVQDVQNRVFSTLGQPNWLAAYFVALSPIALALAMLNAKWPMLNKKPMSILFIIYHLSFVILFFLVLLFTRSRSGLLGFAIADIIFWGLLYLKSKVKVTLRFPFIIYHLSFIILFFVFGTQIQLFKKPSQPQTYTAPVLESGGTESGAIRKYVWEGAINAWKSSTKTILIGTGTETFAFAFYQYRPVGHNLTSEWDFLYNKAHNEYLNYLATTGVFGLGSYLLFIGSFIWWFAKMLNDQWPMANKKENDIFSIYHLALIIALFAGWTSILVTNFFGFSVVVTQIFLFLFPALIFVPTHQNTKTIKLRLPSWLVWVPVVVGIYVFIKIGLYWYADTIFAAGYRLNRSGNYALSKNLLSRASALNPTEPFYHDELSTAIAALAVEAVEDKDATLAAQLAQQSLKESDIALKTSPKNVNFWRSRTKIFYAFSAFDAQFNKAAISALEKARTLSPNDPKIIYNLAILTGREGENEKAIELLKHATQLKRNYRDAYWALSIFYTETKQTNLARGILQEYLTSVDPNDKEFQEKTGQ